MYREVKIRPKLSEERNVIGIAHTGFLTTVIMMSNKWQELDNVNTNK